MSIKRKLDAIKVYISAAVLLVPFLAVALNQTANAATLQTTYVRLNRIKTGTGTSVRVQLKAVSSQTANVTVDFNGTDTGTARWTDGANAGVVNATQTITTATCASETGDTALPGVITAAGSGAVVTVSAVGATTSGTTYCFDLTSATAVTTPTTAGEYHPTITIGTDSNTGALRIISNDQIVVTATVPPTFNFVLSGNTDTFSTNLSTSSVVSTAGKTVTITSNAASGWIVWVKNLNGSSGAATKGALKSTAASNYTIPTTNANALGSASHTLSTGTEDYGLGTTITTDAGGGGTVSLDAAYDGTSSKAGVLDPTNFRVVATSNGTANGDVIDLTERATIAGGTPAANDYTDTLTVIGAGNF
jgi:hypothetical protein